MIAKVASLSGGAFLAFAATWCWAADLGSISLPYNNQNAITVGSGVDIDLINQQRNSCLKVGDDDLKWLDTEGAVATIATIELVSDYKSLAKTLNLEVDYKSKTDVGIAALKAGGSLNLNVKYDTFAKDESRSLAIVVKAESDYGRHGLRQYVLDTPYSTLLTEGKVKDFREQCGTHSVVAEHKIASVAVVIQMSDLTHTGKDSIEGMYKTSFKAGGKVDVLTLKASQDFMTKWKSVIDTASRLSTINVRFESKGGVGISDATKLAATSDPSQIDNILKALSELGTSFTKENSAPVSYALVSNTVFGAPIKVVDPSKLDTLNAYYLQLAKIDFALSKVAKYKDNFPDVYSIYYTKPIAALKSHREQLIAAIEGCVLKDLCTYKLPSDLGLLYVEDIVQPESVTLDCSYERFNGADVQGRQIGLDVLTNISVNLRGKVRLAKYVSLDTATLARFGPRDGAVRQIPTFPAVSLSQPAADGTARIVATLDYVALRPDVNVNGGSFVINNENAIFKARELLTSSVYSIAMQAVNGMSIQNAVGPPYGGNCPISKNV